MEFRSAVILTFAEGVPEDHVAGKQDDAGCNLDEGIPEKNVD